MITAHQAARQVWLEDVAPYLVLGGVSGPTATVPGAPVSLALGTATSSTQPLSWSAPVSDGGASITGYNVYYALHGGGYSLFGTVAGTSVTVTGLTDATSYDYYVTAVNSVGEGTASNVVTGSTLLDVPHSNQWKLDEASGDAIDSVGSFNVTSAGNPGSTAGKIGNCRTFNGSQYFSKVASDALAGTNADFSFSVWFNPSSIGVSNAQIVSCRAAGSADGNLAYILRNEFNTLKLYIGTGAGAFDSWTVATGITTSTWYHLAFSFNNSTGEVRWRLNGGSVVSQTTANKPATAGASLKFLIGGDVLELFVGSIDAVLSYAGRWSDAQLLKAYNSGNGIEF